jgi:thiamine pyrophosphate-dependent acetolactate synthase large subunit-like protein
MKAGGLVASGRRFLAEPRLGRRPARQRRAALIPASRAAASDRPQAAEQVLRFGPTDFAAVAHSFGLPGLRVERPGDIAPALREAIAAKETVVVDVATDIEARAPEPWTPREED